MLGRTPLIGDFEAARPEVCAVQSSASVPKSAQQTPTQTLEWQAEERSCRGRGEDGVLREPWLGFGGARCEGHHIC